MTENYTKDIDESFVRDMTRHLDNQICSLLGVNMDVWNGKSNVLTLDAFLNDPDIKKAMYRKVPVEIKVSSDLMQEIEKFNVKPQIQRTSLLNGYYSNFSEIPVSVDESILVGFREVFNDGSEKKSKLYLERSMGE